MRAHGPVDAVHLGHHRVHRGLGLAPAVAPELDANGRAHDGFLAREPAAVRRADCSKRTRSARHRKPVRLAGWVRGWSRTWRLSKRGGRARRRCREWPISDIDAAAPELHPAGAVVDIWSGAPATDRAQARTRRPTVAGQATCADGAALTDRRSRNRIGRRRGKRNARSAAKVQRVDRSADGTQPPVGGNRFRPDAPRGPRRIGHRAHIQAPGFLCVRIAARGRATRQSAPGQALATCWSCR